MATMTDEPLKVEMGRIDALESFSVESQSNKNKLDKQLISHLEQTDNHRLQLWTQQMKPAVSRHGYKKHIIIEKHEPEPDPLDPRSTCQSPVGAN